MHEVYAGADPMTMLAVLQNYGADLFAVTDVISSTYDLPYFLTHVVLC